jgi:transcription elongation factor/antiterminator RfaH
MAAMNTQAISASARAEFPKIGVLSSSSMTLAEGERWYAVHTLPCNETRAEWHLGNQGFRTFMPKRRKTVRHARKLSTVDAAFFPRYLFVVLDPSRHQWRCINGTYGVSRLVMRGDMPQPVPCGVVEALIASVDASGILQLGQRLQIGSPVRLLAGPFAEQLAILDRLDDAGRVRVLLDIFGRKVAVSTGTNNVLPLA